MYSDFFVLFFYLVVCFLYWYVVISVKSAIINFSGQADIVSTNFLISMATTRLTPVFAAPSLKSAVVIYLQEGCTISAGETTTKGDCEFVKVPCGFALMKGDFKEPSFKGGCAKKAAANNLPEAKGLVAGKLQLGSFPECDEKGKLSTTFRLPHNIPKRAWGYVNIKTAFHADGTYSGGFDYKGRELVYVFDCKFEDSSTMTVSGKKRVYPHQIEKMGYGWEDDLWFDWTIRVPKEEVVSESEESDGGNALLGGDDSSSDDDSSS